MVVEARFSRAGASWVLGVLAFRHLGLWGLGLRASGFGLWGLGLRALGFGV